MKIKPSQVNTIVKQMTSQPTEKICTLLVYGTDPGLIRSRIQSLQQKLVPDPNDLFSVSEYSPPTLQQNNLQLLELMITPTYNGQKRLVTIYDASDSITPAVKAVLKEGEERELCGFLLLEAQDLSVRSTLRTLLEKTPLGAAIPCYVESGQQLQKSLNTLAQNYSLILEPDACTHLAYKVIGNHAIAKSELEKLSLYISPRKRATLQDVKNICDDNAILEQNQLVFAVAQRNWKTVNRHLLHKKHEPISLLRSVQRHFQRLHQVISHHQSGLPFENALNTLKPPVFFKYKKQFEIQAYQWSLNEIQHVLTLINNTEIQCKQTAMPTNALCTMLLFQICHPNPQHNTQHTPPVRTDLNNNTH